VYGLPEHHVALPSIERPKKLPVVLSREEIKLLLKTPRLHRHRLLLARLYGCVLRNAELRNLHIKDVDMDRKQLHIRQGKGRKDRYVPLCDLPILGIRICLAAEHPVQWHGLRHTYAAHLLEMGMDIMSLKDLLGACGHPDHNGVPARITAPQKSCF
jgi:site-specific recombinase XerD